MSLDTRLNKVMPALSAKERFLIETRAIQAGEPQDPLLRSTMPPGQVGEFNRLVGLKQAINVTLAHYVSVVALLADKLQLRFVWMHSLCQVGVRLWYIAELIPARKRGKAEAIAATSMHGIDLPWDNPEKTNTWLDLAETLEMNLGRDTLDRWLELLALERVLDEAAQSVDGEDLASPYVRELLVGARQILERLSEALEVEVPVLDDDGSPLVELRELMKRAQERFG